MTLLILARHGQSTLNVEQRVNGDPRVPVGLTGEGADQARRLGVQIAQLPIELCVHTRFERTRMTAALALQGRDVPFREEPLLDDIALGVLEGRPTDEYREWKRSHSRDEPFPDGESLNQAALRYARGFKQLAASDAGVVLVVCHEIPVRYAINAASGSGSLDAPLHDVPNATPFLFDGRTLERAAIHIERMAGAGGTPDVGEHRGRAVKPDPGVPDRGSSRS